MLELVKYHWEPSGFVKMIVCNSALLLLLKQFRRETMFLGSPLVMTFLYMYSREYEAQVAWGWTGHECTCSGCAQARLSFQHVRR